MIKLVLLFSLFVVFSRVNAQVEISFSKISGVVLECRKNVPLSYVHVVNETSKSGFLTDSVGNFAINVKPGDILKFSSIGFKPTFIEMNIEKINFFHSVCLSLDTLLLPEAVILPYNNYDEFKHQFLALKVKSTEYSIPGVTLKQRTTLHNLDDEKYVKSLGFALASPISALYYNFSRHEKNIRKYYQFENEKWQQYEIDQKYNRKIVATITGFKDEKLTDFMAWCNFSRSFLIITTEYEIVKKIKEKYDLYCDNHESK